MKKLLLVALLFAAVLALPTEAEFFQCPPACDGSDNADVMIGSAGPDTINGLAGNDIIFGGEGRDDIRGQLGDEVIFGGLGSDPNLTGNEGNDTLIPGPDDAGSFQRSYGNEGNDTFIVLVGETVNCQEIWGNEGLDVLHLIGFGPYASEFPFGAPEPIANDSAIVIQDPIAGGYIFVFIGNGSDYVERINGLATPNPTVITFAEFVTFIGLNCIDTNG